MHKGYCKDVVILQGTQAKMKMVSLRAELKVFLHPDGHHNTLFLPAWLGQWGMPPVTQ